MLRLHIRPLIPALFVVICFAQTAGSAEPTKPTDTIQLGGAVETPAQWSADSLAKDFAADVTVVNYTLKGQPGKARAVPLIKLVQAAKLKIDPKQKNHLLAFSVVVRAADGYAAAFSLAEIHPDFAGAEVYIALDKDDKPLPENQRPVSLLVPSDKKPSRWVHGVISITVIDGLAGAKTAVK
jgi:hypothetical protein